MAQLYLHILQKLQYRQEVNSSTLKLVIGILILNTVHI